MITSEFEVFLEQYATKELVDPDVEEFLEHYGKRGQRWGVTNRSSSNNSSKIRGSGIKRTALIVGGATAGILIAKHFNIPMKSIKMVGVAASGATAGGILANAILKKQGNKKANEIKNARKVLFGDK